MPKKTKKQPEKQEEEEYLSDFDAASYLKVDEVTIRLWKQNGFIKIAKNRVGPKNIPLRAVKEFRLVSGQFSARGEIQG